MDLPAKSKAFKESEDNPFKHEISDWRDGMKEGQRSIGGEGYQQSDIVVLQKTRYYPAGFAKLYQNKDLLWDLSPNACKILLFIALHMNYNEEKLRIPQRSSGLCKKAFARGMLELLTKRIVAKEKKEWYWINVTLLIVGHIDKNMQQV